MKLKLIGKIKSLCVVLCSNGYPEDYEKNITINNFDKLILDENNYLFHAGTRKEIIRLRQSVEEC